MHDEGNRPPRETELKLELDRDAVAAFRRQVGRALGAPEGTKRLNAVYFDTRKHSLRRRGLALRLRDEDGCRVQTLKADAGGGAGLFDRSEWESPASGDHPDPDLFDDRMAGDLLPARGRLEPVFATNFERTTWTVADGRSRIEVAVDDGTVEAGFAACAVAEVELELKGGEPADLFRLARRLAETGRLRVSVQSKSERGYALFDVEGPAGVKAGPIRLSRGMNAGEAFQAIARSCLRHFRLNEGALIEARRVEALHQARVAMRRLRSALSIFGDVVADAEVERIRAELRGLSRLLGTARNLDVLLAGPLAAARAGAPDEDGLAELVGLATAAREKAYDRVIRKLRSRRFRVFTVDLVAWIEAGPWLHRAEAAEARSEPAWAFATATLERRRRKVRKGARALAKATPEHRHEVRIAAKKLRYASEFFAGLVKGGKAKRHHRDLLKVLGRLQESLGELNDLRTERTLVKRLVGPARTGAAAGGMAALPLLSGQPGAESRDDRERMLLREAVAARRDFVDAPRFW